MAAARYWRLQGIETYGYKADLELSELALYEGATRVDGSATLTSTVAPVSGTLADLKDGDLATTARFLGAEVFSPGFSINWDFGAGVTKTISGVRIGAASSEWRFIYSAHIQSSEDSLLWTTQFSISSTTYLGPHAFGDIFSSDPFADKLVLAIPMEGANNGTTFLDLTGKTVTATNATTSTDHVLFGSSSGKFSGSGYLTTQSSSDFSFSGDFTIQMWVRLNLYPGGNEDNDMTLLSVNLDTSPANYTFMFYLNYIQGGVSWWDGTNSLISSTGTPLNVWTHVAATVQGRTIRVFSGGFLRASKYSALPSYSFTNALFSRVGGMVANDNTRFLYGDLRDVSIHKGVALYTEDFTPPAFSSLGSSASGARHTGSADPQRVNYQSVGDTRHTSYPPLVLSKDMQYGGRGKVVGTVKQKSLPANTPLGRRVRLINERDGAVVREGWSHPDTGAYEFLDIDPSLTYTVLSYDHLHNFRAVVADNLTPELMP